MMAQVAPVARLHNTVAPDLDTLIERATVLSVEHIRPAAWAIHEFASGHGLRAALCANIATNDPIRDAAGHILAEEVFNWRAPHERWWEQPNIALTTPFPRACRYECVPFWCNARGFHTITPNPYLDDIGLAHWFDVQPRCKAAIVVPVHLPFSIASCPSMVPPTICARPLPRLRPRSPR